MAVDVFSGVTEGTSCVSVAASSVAVDIGVAVGALDPEASGVLKMAVGEDLIGVGVGSGVGVLIGEATEPGTFVPFCKEVAVEEAVFEELQAPIRKRVITKSIKLFFVTQITH